MILVAVGGVTMERLLTLLHRGARAEMMEETPEFNNRSGNILRTPQFVPCSSSLILQLRGRKRVTTTFYFGNGTCDINVTSSYPHTCTSTLFLPAAPRGKTLVLILATAFIVS